MDQCYQNENLVSQQIRNMHFSVYEQHFGITNDIPLTCTVPPNPFLWFPPVHGIYMRAVKS